MKSDTGDVAPGLLPIVRFDSRDLPPDQQFAAWARFSQYHESTPLDPRDGFHVEASAWRLGALMLADTRVDPMRYRRSEAKLRADGADHYTIMMQAEGSWQGDIGGTGVSVGPGEACVLDLSRPMTAASAARTRSIVLMIPRDTLDELLPPFEMHGLVLRSGLCGLFCDYLVALVERLATIADPDTSARLTLDLLVGCLAGRRPEEASTAATEAVRARARRYIGRNLSRPLHPAEIAAALNVSRSTLYRAFQPLAGVIAYVQKRRLARVHSLLGQPGERRSIAALAFAHGFPNPTHFGREYKKAYGCTPNATRAGRGRERPADGFDSEDETELFRSVRRRMG